MRDRTIATMATGAEVEELKELFASPPRPNSPPRESALPLTRIAKFGVADENRRLAEQGRMEREERLRQREQEAAERLAKAHASKANALETNERARLHKEMTQEMNQSLVRSIRETEAEWQTEREMAYHGFRNEARKRVLIANGLDARLDAQEAAVDAEERRLATRDRQELMRQVEQTREDNLLNKRDNASHVRETTTMSVAKAMDDTSIKKKLAAEHKRVDSRQWAKQKEANRLEQVARSNIGKAAVSHLPCDHATMRLCGCATVRPCDCATIPSYLHARRGVAGSAGAAAAPPASPSNIRLLCPLAVQTCAALPLQVSPSVPPQAPVYPF